MLKAVTLNSDGLLNTYADTEKLLQPLCRKQKRQASSAFKELMFCPGLWQESQMETDIQLCDCHSSSCDLMMAQGL